MPNVRSPEGKRKITDYNNKRTLLPSAGDNTGYAAVHCRWQKEIVATEEVVYAFREGGFG